MSKQQQHGPQSRPGDIAQGHPVVPGMEADGAGSHVTANRQPGMPTPGVELRMTAAHPENAMNQTATGGVPSVRLQVQDAARGAGVRGFGHPDDFAAPPQGAQGLAHHEFTGDYHITPIGPDHPALATPQGPAGPAGHNLERRPGELQGDGRPGHLMPPGWAHSTPSPGDVTPFGERPR